MARVLVITNPVAARTTEASCGQVVTAFERSGWQVDRWDTTCATDARNFAREGIASGVDAIAVFGGDGTTMQAVASIVGTGTPLVLVPGGTGNILAGNLRIPSDPVAAVEAATRGRLRRIDLGRVMLEDGAHYFGVACGAGVDARVMGETGPTEKRRWGMFAYVATTLRILSHLRSTPTVITVDDRTFEARSAMLLILNCAEIIPGLLRIRPEISLDDGVLDLLVVSADSPAQAIRGAYRVLRNSFGALRDTAYLRYARGKTFRIEPAESLPVQFDGDPAGRTPFSAEVMPGALTVMVPGT